MNQILSGQGKFTSVDFNTQERYETEKRVLGTIIGYYDFIKDDLDFEHLRYIVLGKEAARILQAISLTEPLDRDFSNNKLYNKLDIHKVLTRICAGENEICNCEKYLLDIETDKHTYFRFFRDIEYLKEYTGNDTKKRLGELLTNTKKDPTSAEIAIKDAIRKAYETIFKVSEEAPCSVSEILEKMKEKKAPSVSIRTGNVELDEKTGGGFKTGQLIILAAQPGVGKTTFALNMINLKLKTLKDGCAAIFTLEMASEEILSNLMTMTTGLPLDIGRAHFTGEAVLKEYRETLNKAATEFQEYNLHIYDKSYGSLDRIIPIIKKLKKDKDLKLVVIDYLQLIAPSPGVKEEIESISHKLSNITRRLKELTLDLDICIICLSQLNRNFDKRKTYSREKENETPELSDLRGSGTIEQDADMVFFLYESNGMTFLKIAKNRRGREGIIAYNFDKNRGLFKEAKNND